MDIKKTIKVSKSYISNTLIILVDGYVRNVEKLDVKNKPSLIHSDVKDLVLFYFCKPIIMNVKCFVENPKECVTKCILHCPINDHYSSIIDKIKNTLRFSYGAINIAMSPQFQLTYNNKRISKENWVSVSLEYKENHFFEYKLRNFNGLYTGTCQRYDCNKGYGFIECDNGSKDVFVHQTEIYASRYRTLKVGEPLEFYIIVQDDGRRKAVNVTGPNGCYVQGISLNGVRYNHDYGGYTRRGYRGGGYRRGGFGGYRSGNSNDF